MNFNGGRRLFVELLMLLFNGLIQTDDGSLGRSLMQLNEDDGDKMLADVIWSAMINEGNDCDENRPWEERVIVYMGWRIKCRWMLRA